MQLRNSRFVTEESIIGVSVAVMTFVRFQVLTAASMKMTLIWNVAPCNLVEVYRRFKGAYCLHHQGDESPVILV
jgi:hypothetical protein